ncbi:MAG: cytochrome c oxidase assembly protein [Chloroflexota bacterium]
MGYESLSRLAWHWTFEPTVIGGIILASSLYTWLASRPNYAVSNRQRICFATAMILIAGALLSPLDVISDDYLFSAHMVQHLILVLAAAPLLLVGLPAGMGRRFSPRLLVAYLPFNAVFLFSHAPAWYNATLRFEPLHAFEHLVYIVTAMVMWLPVLNPAVEKRASPGLRVLYIFLQTIPMFILGALLSLGDEALYRHYELAPRLLPMTAAQDQVLGGLIMWLGGSLFYLGVLTVVFFNWARVDLGAELVDDLRAA